MINSLVLLIALTPQNPAPEAAIDPHDPWRAFAREASAKIRPRHRGLDGFWIAPPRGPQKIYSPGEPLPPPSPEELERRRAEGQAQDRALALWRSGKKEEALRTIRDGLIEFGARDTLLPADYAMMLAGLNRWEECRDFLGANLQGGGFAFMMNLFGLALVETDTPTPGLADYFRVTLRGHTNVMDVPPHRFYPASEGRAGLRRLAWAAYAQKLSYSLGLGSWAVEAMEKAHRLDPLSPILSSSWARMLVQGDEGAFPISDKAAAKAEALRVLTKAFAAQKDGTEARYRLYWEVRNLDRAASRKLPEPKLPPSLIKAHEELRQRSRSGGANWGG